MRPWWQHGSSETYMVAPGWVCRRPPRAPSPSAWLSPGGCVIPSPRTWPSLTTTAPTIGLGLVCPRAPGELDRSAAGACASRSVAAGSGHPKTPYQRPVSGPATNVRPRAPPASPRARADSRRRLCAARLEHRLRPSVRLLDRRGVAFHLARGRDVLAGPRPRLLPEPGHVHVPDLRGAAGDVRAARFPVRPAVRERHRPVRQEPDRDLDRGPNAGRVPVHGRRRGHLLGGPPPLGDPRGPRGGGDHGLRLPAGGLFTRGGDRRGSADRCFPVARAGGACPLQPPPAPPFALAGIAAGSPCRSSTRPVSPSCRSR